MGVEKEPKREPSRQQPRPRKTKFICKAKGCMKHINSISLKHNDPFCSTTCARAFYNNPLPAASIWSKNYESPA